MILLSFLVILPFFTLFYSQNKEVSFDVMNRIYEEIKIPYKYGLVLVPEDNTKIVDSPSIFQHKGRWYMTYIVFDNQGYETWITQSNYLLQWKSMGKTLFFTKGTWDANQKAGYIALQDYTWDGSYELEQYRGNTGCPIWEVPQRGMKQEFWVLE